MLALQGRVLPAQPAQRETDFYVIPRPVFLFRTCCCFRRGSLGLTQLLPVLLYPGQRPRTIMHPRLLSFPRTYLLYHDAHGLWRIPVCVFIHSHCDHSIFKKKKKPSGPGFLQESWTRRGKPWRRNENFVEFCLLSQSLVGLHCYVVAMEKNIGSCAIKLIQEKTFPRVFQSRETDGKLQNS